MPNKMVTSLTELVTFLNPHTCTIASLELLMGSNTAALLDPTIFSAMTQLRLLSISFMRLSAIDMSLFAALVLQLNFLLFLYYLLLGGIRYPVLSEGNWRVVKCCCWGMEGWGWMCVSALRVYIHLNCFTSHLARYYLACWSFYWAVLAIYNVCCRQLMQVLYCLDW